jgi:hypothetical protein
MSDTQFSTLLKAITGLGGELRREFKANIGALRKEMYSEFRKHDKKCDERHDTILKTIEYPYLEHDHRITKLEKSVYAPN